MAPTSLMLLTRQSSTGDNCPSTISSGGIAGIVLGSIAGTLLLIWLWRACRLPGAMDGGTESDAVYQVPVVSSSRNRRKRRRGSAGTYVDYVEKPTSTRRYRDNVRRPPSVYLTDT